MSLPSFIDLSEDSPKYSSSLASSPNNGEERSKAVLLSADKFTFNFILFDWRENPGTERLRIRIDRRSSMFAGNNDARDKRDD